MTRRGIWVAAVSCTALGAWGAYRLARSTETQLFGELVPRVETAERVVALTFDDGPVPARADEVLEMLRSLEVRATFFVTGAELAAAPEAGRRLLEAGHEMGNHSYSHVRLVLKSPSFVRHELEATDALIRQAGAVGAIRFRPPYGKKLVVLPWLLWRTGRTSVTWDVDADSALRDSDTPRTIAIQAASEVRPGSIVLFHVWYDGRDRSRAAVPLFVEMLRERGYRFVTVGELLSARRAAASGATFAEEAA